MCQPTDLLLSHISESGMMVFCGEVEIWMSFFNALTLTRSLAESDTEWPLLLQCSLERLHVTHQRLAGTVGNPFSVWTSGDATMNRMGGINWKMKEYFKLPPEEFLSDFHQGETTRYKISEIELVASVGIVVFWGDMWNGRHIILLGSDNQNTIPWIDNRVAKKGLALRIIATFHVWRVENGVEVYPLYLRSLRNSRPDFATRESKHEIALRAEREEYKRVGRPW